MSDGRRDTFDAHTQAQGAGIAAARAVAAGIRARMADTHAAQAWRGMPATVRLLLVQLATDRPDDAARMPWDAFTDTEQCAIGATGRELRRQLAACDVLR